MSDPQKVINEYQEKMKEYNQNIKELKKNLKNGMVAEKTANEKLNNIKEKAKSEQQNYQENYKKAIDNRINDLKSKVANSELPNSVASLDSLEEVSRTELQALAENFEDNYWAQKKINEIAKKDNIPVSTNNFDLDNEVKKLQNEKLQAHRKFSSNPLEDTPDKIQKRITENTRDKLLRTKRTKKVK